MNRRALSDLGRDELISRAKTQGVPRPELLTRVELVDELLRRTVTEPSRQRAARGLFGRARDLIAEVVERGLHLPETAEKIRGIASPSAPPTREPVATVTLAQIYAAQGHRDRALDVLDQVLATEPEHAAARSLRARLLAAEPPAPATSTPTPAPTTLPGSSDASPPVAASSPSVSAPPPVRTVSPEERPASMLDDFPLPRRYDVDEAVVLPVEPTTAYVYWEVRPATLARAKATQPSGRLVVRVTATTNHGGRMATDVRDIAADVLVGDYFLFGLPPGALLRAALGWLSAETLEAFAMSPALVTPRATPVTHVASTVVAWSPAATPPQVVSRPPPAIAVAVALAQSQEASAPQTASDAPRAETTEPLSMPAPRVSGRRIRVPGGSSGEWQDVVDGGSDRPGGLAPPGSSDGVR